MREIRIEKLTLESFKSYGHYENMINPDTYRFGQPPIEFFRDMLQLDLGNSTIASFSICRIEKRPEVIDIAERNKRVAISRWRKKKLGVV